MKLVQLGFLHIGNSTLVMYFSKYYYFWREDGVICLMGLHILLDFMSLHYFSIHTNRPVRLKINLHVWSTRLTRKGYEILWVQESHLNNMPCFVELGVQWMCNSSSNCCIQIPETRSLGFVVKSLV